MFIKINLSQELLRITIYLPTRDTALHIVVHIDSTIYLHRFVHTLRYTLLNVYWYIYYPFQITQSNTYINSIIYTI